MTHVHSNLNSWALWIGNHRKKKIISEINAQDDIYLVEHRVAPWKKSVYRIVRRAALDAPVRCVPRFSGIVEDLHHRGGDSA